MQNYKELKVWEKAHQFVLEVYRITKTFPKDELFALTNQFRRASVSVAANITEGCGKKTQKEFARYLNISLASSNECEYFVLLSRDLGYLNMAEFEALNKRVNIVKAMLINLIAKVSSTQ